jgi:hypothetical protein
MKKTSRSKSAFLQPRVLLSFALAVVGVVLAVIAFTLSSGETALAQKPKADQPAPGAPQVIKMVGPVSQDLDLRALPFIANDGEEDEVRLMRHPTHTSRLKEDAMQAVRESAIVATMPAPIATYAGITSVQSGCGCLPPDTHGDVGPNHYIQSVNSSIKILDKSGNQLLAPTTFNSFFSGLATSGTPCGLNQNRGDGIVHYDHMADRWIVSDFAFPSFPGVSFYQCIGVSKTSDPVAGGWWLYALQVDPANPNQLGDYPKMGIWPDAYYLTVNLFTNNTTFNGVRVFALPRLAMINGTGAPNPGAIAYTLSPATLGDSYSLVAATFRSGNPPPAGTDEYLISIDSPSAADVVLTQVHAWRFHPDFVTPANSTFGVGPDHAPNAQITVNGFVDAFTTVTAIVPQNGTTARLDTLGDKIMTPMIYQNRAGVESLWAAHTVNNNQNGTGPTAIRWYQFNVTGGTIPATAAQQQTFNNGADGIWRFQPSLFVDGQGNLAIGYSASSATTEPSIRYAGRLANDPPNTLAQGEATLIVGGGHQTSGSGRWGDYSGMGLDPSDNATFWHTHEYYSGTSASAWNTRIGTFKFPSAPTATSIVSRKTHGAAGDFDIPLPTTGTPGVECRTGPVAGSHQVIVTFANPVTVSGASVSGTGSASFSVSGPQVTVNLTGIADAQRLIITLSNVNDGTNSGDVLIPMNVLLGDRNGNGSVTASDVGQVKAESGQAVDATTFRSDINANGSITATDVSQTKSLSGNSLP